MAHLQYHCSSSVISSTIQDSYLISKANYILYLAWFSAGFLPYLISALLLNRISNSVSLSGAWELLSITLLLSSTLISHWGAVWPAFQHGAKDLVHFKIRPVCKLHSWSPMAFCLPFSAFLNGLVAAKRVLKYMP